MSFEASAKPFARRLEADLVLAPWAEEPTLGVTFEADGISGGGLDALARDLSTWIDGSGLTDGVATGSVEAKLRWRRRSPLDLDFRSGLAADVEVGRLEFRDAPDGNVLLALDGASAEIARIDSGTGSVHVKTLELRRPEMRGGRTPDGGFAILGLVVHPELRPGAPTEESAPSPEPAADSVTKAPAPTSGEVRIDEILVRGIAVEVRDDAATPPTVLPLVELDVLVQRFTTRAFEEPRVIRFDAWLAAGEAEMPRPAHASSLISGFATAIGDVLEGKDEKLRYEKRPIFQEAALTGRVQFVPALTGHAQATLTGLELLGFAGTAKHEGVAVGDGTMDASVRLRFRGAEGVRVDSEIVFSDLSLQEPKSGPIETYLTLPVPLDTVLFLLENADGEHRIPVGFTLDEEGLTTSKMTTAARARRPGAGHGDRVRSAARAVDVHGPVRPDRRRGEAAAQRARGVRAGRHGAHGRSARGARAARREAAQRPGLRDPGAAPAGRRGRRASRDVRDPSPEDCREIVDGLRRRRAELSRERRELAADLRATWGAGGARSPRRRRCACAPSTRKPATSRTRSTT